MGALVGLGIERNFGALLTMSTSASVGLTVTSLLSAFCCTVGYRLALYRPNRYGSVFSPNFWLVLTVAFGSLGLVLGAMSFLSQQPPAHLRSPASAGKRGISEGSEGARPTAPTSRQHAKGSATARLNETSLRISVYTGVA
jgi:hypothetical protein